MFERLVEIQQNLHVMGMLSDALTSRMNTGTGAMLASRVVSGGGSVLASEMLLNPSTHKRPHAQELRMTMYLLCSAVCPLFT
jgi:hypothetical protein